MAYVTLQDLIDRYTAAEIQQIAPGAEDDDLDAARIDAACLDAQGEIDSHLLAGGYATPISPVPAVIRAFAADIARYRLYDNDAPKAVADRYAEAKRFLRAVGRGDVKLSATEPTSPVGDATFEGGRQVFGGGGF